MLHKRSLGLLFVDRKKKVIITNPAALGDQFRYILRGLLRESRFLPNEQARKWIPSWILLRYRRIAQDKEINLLKDPSRLRDHLAEARHQLQRLRWANQGEPQALKKVLMMSYGRTGKRQHDLVRNMLERPDPMKDASSNTASQNDWLQRHQGLYPQSVSSQLIALQISQKQHDLPMHYRREMRYIKCDIHGETIWKKPMAECRVRNKKKKYLAETLMGLMPPLPHPEYEELRELVSDRKRCTIPARPVRSSWIPEQHDLVRARSQHQITERFMRRLLAQVWALCPLMRYETEKGMWSVSWENASKPSVRKVTGGSPDFDVGRKI